MLILHEGELLHTDSSTEILEHYGTKGMKWGKRLRSAASKVASDKRVRATGRYLKEYGKETSKLVGKSYTNPLLSNKASSVATMYDLRKGNLSSALLIRNKAAMKRMNDYVDDRVDLKDTHKTKQRKTKGVKNKVDNYVQYRRNVSDMNKKYAGRKGY
jgi:hypothetical protein